MEEKNMRLSRSERIRGLLENLSVGEYLNYPLYAKEIDSLIEKGFLVTPISTTVNPKGLTWCRIERM